MRDNTQTTPNPTPAPQAFAPTQGLLSSLGDFAYAFRLEDAPEVVRRQARLTLLDAVGCMLAGANTPESQNFLRAEKRLSAGAQASVVGLADKLGLQAATRANAYFGDVFELNDLTGGHAGIAVVPATLAYAEAHGKSGRELIEAIIVGVEAVSRVYDAYYPTMKSYEDTGITPPGIPSTLGTTAALARMAGLDAQGCTRALQIAGALAGWCPAEVIFGQGGTIKPMMFGSWPGSVALQAVAYAEVGFDGPPHLLESKIGLYATLAHSFRTEAITAPSLWHLAQPRRKRHACCGYIHAALDAVIALRQQGQDVAFAATLEVSFPAYIIPGVSKSGPPRTANEARFHAEYCIALAVHGADLILPAHSIDIAAHMPQVEGLLPRIRVVENAALTHYHQCVVRGLDANGKEIFQQALKAPKGAPLDPMSDAEVEEKFRLLCADRLAPGALNGYLAAVAALESAPQCDWVIRSFC
jgi:2-methylcitrate dehydratase PrpD